MTFSHVRMLQYSIKSYNYLRQLLIKRTIMARNIHPTRLRTSIVNNCTYISPGTIYATALCFEWIGNYINSMSWFIIIYATTYYLTGTNKNGLHNKSIIKMKRKRVCVVLYPKMKQWTIIIRECVFTFYIYVYPAFSLFNNVSSAVLISNCNQC